MDRRVVHKTSREGKKRKEKKKPLASHHHRSVRQKHKVPLAVG
jgi:hypothetical protein